MLMPCIVLKLCAGQKRDGRMSRLLYATLWGHTNKSLAEDVFPSIL